MPVFSDRDHNDRQSASRDAKKALLEKFKAKTGTNDPEAQARLEERRLIAERRAAKEAEKEAQRKAELERIAAEKAAKKAAEQAAREAEEAARAAEEAARAAERPKRVFLDAVAYAQARAKGGKR